MNLDMSRNWATLGAALAAVAVPFAACKSEFASCEESYSCESEGGASGDGEGSSAGDSGEDDSKKKGGSGDGLGGGGSTEGAAGGPPMESGEEAPECEEAADCAPAEGCTLAEACEEGECVERGSACGDYDADNCDCAEDEFGECALEGVDEDEDGYLSAACEAEPGYDCNDEDDKVHPDAEEICDGIDNDCNGEFDLGDGLPLGGESRSLSETVRLAVAWSPLTKAYGLALGAEGTRLASLSETGVLEESVLLIENHGSAYSDSPRMHFGEVGFGVLSIATACYSTGTGGGCVSVPRFVERAGSTGTVFGLSSELWGADVGFLDGDWIYLNYDSSRMTVARLSEGVEQAGTELAMSGSGIVWRPRLAVHGETVAVSWPNNGFHWARLDKDLSLQAYEQLTSDPVKGSVASVSEGYALAWVGREGLSFQMRSSDGAQVCGPTEVDFGSPVESNLSRGDIAIAASDRGTLVLALDHSESEVGLFRFGDDCELLDSAPIAQGVEHASYLGIATGDESVAVTWTEAVGSVKTANYRVMGSALCE